MNAGHPQEFAHLASGTFYFAVSSLAFYDFIIFTNKKLVDFLL